MAGEPTYWQNKMEIYEFIGIVTFLYAVANPIGVIPIFLGFTKSLKPEKAIKIVYIAAISVAVFLSVSVLLGEQILRFFNVSLDDFRIAGGLLVLYIAFNMFRAHYGGIMQTSDEKSEAEEEVSHIAITPLAFPLLVGPAEMSIMITYANDVDDWSQKGILVLAGFATATMILVTLRLAVPINRVLGKTGINVATRVMALIVASIGIRFIVTGIKNHLPGLVS